MDNAGAVSAMTTEKLVERWNHSMNLQLSVSDLSPNVNTYQLMAALMEILTKIGIDREAIITPPPEEERDEHTEYYWDLMPIINMTRVLNHVLAGIQENFTTTMMDLLNPSPRYAHSILLLLTNLASFYATRCEAIEPKERELFEHHDQMIALEQERDDLLGQLNQQAADKASRSIRLQKWEEDKRSITEELKIQRQQHEDEIREMEHVLGQNQALLVQLDKLKLNKDALGVELARVKAQKVNDIEDIKAQYEHAVHSEKEVTSQLDLLKDTLLHKETKVKNLQAVKSMLDEGILSVQEITTLTDNLREANLTTNRQQAELEASVAQRETALREAEASLSQLRTQLKELEEQRQQDNSSARHAVTQAQRGEKEGESCMRSMSERAEQAAGRLQELRTALDQHALDKLHKEQQLNDIAQHFFTELRLFEGQILQESKKAARTMEEKLGKLGGR